MALVYNASFNNQTRTLSLLDKTGNVISSCEIPSKSKELTLTATADNSSVKLTKIGTLSNTYEVNTGSGWTAYTFGTVINLNNGQSCKWRCSAHPTTQSDSNYVRFVMTGSIEASGYITSMLTSNFRNMTSLSGYDYAFSRLFGGCTALKKDSLQCCQTLSPKCFYYTFNGCSSLSMSSYGLLPLNVVLAESCCYGMYSNCTGLGIGYAYGETLENNCFRQMFSGCTNSVITIFTNAKTMGSATDAFKDWLYGVDTTPPPQYMPSFRFVYAYASLGLPKSSPSGIPANWKRVEPST